jgi:hypothetical protein
MGENPMALRPVDSIVKINAKANAKPTVEASKRPVSIRPAGRPNTSITVNATRHGSRRANTNLLAKLVIEIENTARALGGITANNPTMIAKSGKINLGSRTAMTALIKNTETIVIVMKSERARHRLR